MKWLDREALGLLLSDVDEYFADSIEARA